MIKSALIGFMVGFLLCIPIGPINLTVINEAFRKGFARAFSVGVGGTTADFLYCSLAFMGLTSFLRQFEAIFYYFQIISGCLIVGIGSNYLAIDPTKLTPMAKKTESKATHFQKAFPIGFLLGISNPGLFVLWGVVYTTLVSNHWIEPHTREIIPCIVGIFVGSMVWFAFLSQQVSRTHQKFSPRVLMLIARISAFVMITFGLGMIGRTLMRGIR